MHTSIVPCLTLWHPPRRAPSCPNRAAPSHAKPSSTPAARCLGTSCSTARWQPSRTRPSSDAQLLFNVLSLAENDSLAASKTLFVNCTHDTLAGGHLDLVAPQRLVLEVPPLPRAQVDQVADRLPALEAIHRRGFRMAFDYTVLTKDYERWLPLASFIKLDLSVLARLCVGALGQARPEPLRRQAGGRKRWRRTRMSRWQPHWASGSSRATGSPSR